MHFLWLPDVLIDCLGWALLHFLWQGLLAGVAAMASLTALKRCAASARYWVAVGALVLMAALPVATAVWSLREASAVPMGVESSPLTSDRERGRAPFSTEQGQNVSQTIDRHVVDVPTEAPWSTPIDVAAIDAVSAEAGELNDRAERAWSASIQAICAEQLSGVVSGWLVGVLLLSLRLSIGWRRVQRLKWQAQQPAGDTLQQLLGRLIERLKVTRSVQLMESALVEVPTVIGWLKPVILMPATTLTGLSTEQLAALLAHELAHIRRNDYLVNLLQALVETLLFYHPAVWWVSHRIRIEREHCCDDLAVQVCGDELSYAKALVALEELRGPQIKLAMSADGGSLLKRVRRLVVSRDRSAAAPSWGLVATGLMLVGMLAFVTAHAGWEFFPVEMPTEASRDDDVDPVAADDAVKHVAANNDPDMPAGVPSLESLRQAIEDSSKKFATGRMRVEFEKLTDQSWASGKTDQSPFKTRGRIAWRNEGTQWRVDYDGELPNSNSTGPATPHSDLWSSGFDGQRFYDFDRDAQSLVIGNMNQVAGTYAPASLFWNPTNGGLQSVLDTLSKPGVTIEKAQLDGLDGFRVERVVEREGTWRWSAFVCPSRGYLTLELQQFFNQQLVWDCKLSELLKIQPGVWAPQVIRRTSFNVTKDGKSSVAWQYDFSIKELKLGVEEAQSWPTFAERTAGFAHPTLKLPYGVEINDLTRGTKYYNDPWWPEVSAVLKEKHGWPKVSLLPFENVRSNFAAPPDRTFKFVAGGEAAKYVIDADAKGRSLTLRVERSSKRLDSESQATAKAKLVLFWAPWDERSVQALVAAKWLHAELAPHGLQIVALQDADRATEASSTFMKTLELPFSSIVDDFPEVEGSLGKNLVRKTIGVRGIPTGFLLDHQDKVVAIDDGRKLTEQIAGLLTEAGVKDVPILKMDEPLSDEVGRAAEAEWKALVEKATPRTHIKGRVLNGKNQYMAAVLVEIEPRLKLARGGYGGLTIYPDRSATRTFRTNAGGVFEAQSLPKGCYEVRIKPGVGYASRTFDLAVGPGQAGEIGDIVFAQPDVIVGQVVDEDRKPIKGASIEVQWRHPDLDQPNQKTRTPGAMPQTTSADDGTFKLEKLDAGRFTFVVNALGHEPVVMEQLLPSLKPRKVWLDQYPEPLQRKVSLKANRLPLHDALHALCQSAQVDHELDSESLKSHGLTRNMPVTFEVLDLSLGDALEIVLRQFDEAGPLGFAWDGKRVVVSLHEIAQKRRLPPLETVKGPARERYAQLAAERAVRDLEEAQRATAKTPGAIGPMSLKRLQQMVAVTRAEHELVLHEATQTMGQSLTSGFRKKSRELLINRVQTFLELNKIELEIAVDAHRKQSSAVLDAELQRLRSEIERLEKDLARLKKELTDSANLQMPGESSQKSPPRSIIVRGQVQFDGPVPKLPPVEDYTGVPRLLLPKIPTPEQQAFADAERARNPEKYKPKLVPDESLMIGPQGGVKNVFVYLKDVPRGWQHTPPPAEPHVVAVVNNKLTPRWSLLRVGQSLQLSAEKNAELVQLRAEPLQSSGFNMVIEKGKTRDLPTSLLSRNERLPFTLKSDIAPWMPCGWILLSDHPFAALTDHTGRFEIAGLPPGDHELRLWHERAGYLHKGLKVHVSSSSDVDIPPLHVTTQHFKLLPESQLTE